MPTEMGISAGAIAAALLFTNIDKFASFKGLGIEAKMWERRQGETEPLPPTGSLPATLSPISLSPQAKKVLATLWRYQHQVFGDDNTKRWTFAVGPLAHDFPQYLAGLSEAVNQGWAVVSPENYQCMLTNEGLNYTNSSDEIRNFDDVYTF